ncbi:MAG: hypothetical protein H6672_21980 [Anaerolineaceae bacterium]|nr:hypothetical protein [Anaerolineaceae bacterium]
MKRLILFMLLCVFALPVLAQDDAVSITAPTTGSDVFGTVVITGTVNPADLQSYFLEVSVYGEAEPHWTPVTLLSATPVTAGVLAEWPTQMLSDGAYALRLHVVLRSGESLYTVVEPLNVVNANQPIPTVSAAPEIVPRPNPVNTLPVPLGGHVLYFSDDTQAAMTEMGMTWVKWQIKYQMDDTNILNVVRDRINWSHEAGLNVLLSITGEVGELTTLGDDYYPVFADFLGQVAALSPDAIEVWNEMNLDREWPRGRISATAYAQMLGPAYEAIKAVDPQVMVITGALAPTGFFGGCSGNGCDDGPYYQAMASAGVADYADCIGVHYNEGIISPRQLGGDPRVPDYPTRYFKSMTDRAAYPFRNLDIPMCYTELGYLTPEGYGPLPGGFAWASGTTLAEQAEWLAEAVNLAGDDSRIAMVIVWNVDFDGYESDPQAGYAIIRQDGTCPACDTIAALRSE